jgi:hypothetical protein
VGKARELWLWRTLRGRTHLHWLLLASSPLGWLGLAFARYVLLPSPNGHGTHMQLGLPACWPMQHWGIPCPACGLTTSVTHFAHAQAWDSLVAQPLGFALALTALLAPLLGLIVHAAGGDFGRWLLHRLAPRAIGIALGFAGLCWIYKLIATRSS